MFRAISDPHRGNRFLDVNNRMRSFSGRVILGSVFTADGAAVFKHACAFGCEGIVSKRIGSTYRSGRTDQWLKVKNPVAPAARREAEEDWS